MITNNSHKYNLNLKYKTHHDIQPHKWYKSDNPLVFILDWSSNQLESFMKQNNETITKHKEYKVQSHVSNRSISRFI